MHRRCQRGPDGAFEQHAHDLRPVGELPGEGIVEDREPARGEDVPEHAVAA
jgi:hypothetical protein